MHHGERVAPATRSPLTASTPASPVRGRETLSRFSYAIGRILLTRVPPSGSGVSAPRENRTQERIYSLIQNFIFLVESLEGFTSDWLFKSPIIVTYIPLPPREKIKNRNQALGAMGYTSIG